MAIIVVWWFWALLHFWDAGRMSWDNICVGAKEPITEENNECCVVVCMALSV